MICDELLDDELVDMINKRIGPEERLIQKSELKTLINTVESFSPISLVDAVKLNAMSTVAINESLKELEKLGVVQIMDGIICSTANAIKNFDEIKIKMEEFIKDRTPIKIAYDQCPVTLETLMRRTFLMLLRGDVQNKKILLIGDDDFLSLSLSLTEKAKEIIVMDIDEELLQTINKISETNGLEVQTVHYDIRKPLPTKLLSRFDVVFADPPYTFSGINLFLSRGLETLKDTEGGKFYLCFSQLDLSSSEILHVQRAINSAGLVISEILYNFNEYTLRDDMKEYIKSTGIKTHGIFTSSLMRLSTTGNHNQLPAYELNEDIYDYRKNRD